MIVASHQPNFLPYPGFFFKLYCADVFTLSDTVKFSSAGYHNYNYIFENGSKKKLTVPVKGHMIPIGEVELADWRHYREKILKRIWQCYRAAPHHRKVYDLLVDVFRHDYAYMAQLNAALIRAVGRQMHMDATIIEESSLSLSNGTPTAQIQEICSKLGASAYLSGIGAREYLNVAEMEQNGFNVLWADYESLDDGQNLSMLHYLMHNGFIIPDEWKRKKEAMRSGDRV